MEPKNFWKEMQRLCKQRGGTCDDSERGYDCPLCALPCCADRKNHGKRNSYRFCRNVYRR